MATNRLPQWLRKSLAPGHIAASTDVLLKDLNLHTICESGKCPNRDECYSQRTATFMILGDICTRRCHFCSVTTGKPEALDRDEPRRVAEAARRLGLEHVVVTSVNRDDLPDEGVGHFVSVIQELKKVREDILIEILTPDFRRTQKEAVQKILEAGPHIFSHNIETVPSLFKKVRPQGYYEVTLQIFREIRSQDNGMLTKSGMMLGLGETREEVIQVLEDLRSVDCQILTLGQYLQSSSLNLPVERFVAPEEFAEYKQIAFQLGFTWVESAPFVRSSFHAKESFEALKEAIVR